MKRLIFVLAAAAMMFAAPAFAQQYDLVIENGRVMDPETKLDAMRNVGIQDGVIAAITSDEIAGAETIDATGHVVAPGFVDRLYPFWCQAGPAGWCDNAAGNVGASAVDHDH